jgi:hypothetical protein
MLSSLNLWRKIMDKQENQNLYLNLLEMGKDLKDCGVYLCIERGGNNEEFFALIPQESDILGISQLANCILAHRIIKGNLFLEHLPEGKYSFLEMKGYSGIDGLIEAILFQDVFVLYKIEHREEGINSDEFLYNLVFENENLRAKAFEKIKKPEQICRKFFGGEIKEDQEYDFEKLAEILLDIHENCPDCFQKIDFGSFRKENLQEQEYLWLVIFYSNLVHNQILKSIRYPSHIFDVYISIFKKEKDNLESLLILLRKLEKDAPDFFEEIYLKEIPNSLLSQIYGAFSRDRPGMSVFDFEDYTAEELLDAVWFVPDYTGIRLDLVRRCFSQSKRDEEMLYKFFKIEREYAAVEMAAKSFSEKNITAGLLFSFLQKAKMNEGTLKNILRILDFASIDALKKTKLLVRSEYFLLGVFLDDKFGKLMLDELKKAIKAKK